MRENPELGSTGDDEQEDWRIMSSRKIEGEIIQSLPSLVADSRKDAVMTDGCGRLIAAIPRPGEVEGQRQSKPRWAGCPSLASLEITKEKGLENKTKRKRILPADRIAAVCMITVRGVVLVRIHRRHALGGSLMRSQATRSGEPSSGSVTEKRNGLANHGTHHALRAVAIFCLARGSAERGSCWWCEPVVEREGRGRVAPFWAALVLSGPGIDR
ncbi:hypothetical protein B0T18DRAFT_193731 [Schizothecium vesticola]|uniref:Uncharacterized protein n=1 Tax=Schizothecium vesticola TaxID=314040 RepID=A0AA40K2X7_9PEZI|nr:hypothetical protein B0T18DRAFT_193731 [Schizothecium vesticola]